MTPQFINVKNYDVDNGDVSKGDVTKCDVNSSDVFRVQKVMRNNCDVAYSNAPTTGLNSLKSTNEKASNMSRDGVDQSKEGSDRSKRYWTFSTDYVDFLGAGTGQFIAGSLLNLRIKHPSFNAHSLQCKRTLYAFSHVK